MADRVAWSQQTLTEIEGDDWGEPTYPSYVVTNSHRLRHTPLREFTAENLRLMIGQQNSLPLLMPMAIDVLEVDPFAEGDLYPGALLKMAIMVDSQFWNDHPQLWYRMDGILAGIRSDPELSQSGLLPAILAFQTLRLDA